MKLDPGWSILQDVDDTCEELGLPEREDFLTDQGAQVSEWEELPQLKHLQLLKKTLTTLQSFQPLRFQVQSAQLRALLMSSVKNKNVLHVLLLLKPLVVTAQR